MQKMDCELIKQILPAYVKHSASEESAKEVESHLCVCHQCRDYLSKIIDKPFTPPKENKEPVTADRGLTFWEYAVLATAIFILCFFIFLFIKG
ncbi:MAG: hypothetical protein GY858_07365 [Candidatus Omnitrophica bacterium]|nr:hypothetical protein [Candidatus Omnitrophota bacterium]